MRITLLLGLALALPAHAKPIAFADGGTFMHERERNVIETQLFYAPTHRWSAGAATGVMASDDKARRDVFTYVQANVLVKRWNLPDAQGNVFASAGLGTRRMAHTPSPNRPPEHGHGPGAPGVPVVSTESANRITLQGDFETRRIYTSAKVDMHRSRTAFDRYNTFQAGFSPWAHDYDELAVWFIGQVRKYRGMDDKTEGGAFLRLFKRNIWVEVGVNEGRKTQFMLMINY